MQRAGPVLALLFNAFVWGTSWWPLRFLEAHGVHPLWTTAIVFVLASAVIAAWRPAALGRLLGSRALWLLLLAAGTTNAAFNWGVVIGDVVRVVLLFYLMPVWSVLLARLVLHERLDAAAALRVALALAGAAIVLWPEQTGAGFALPWPRSLGDWLGVLGGFTFALNNVMLRREAAQPAEARALAMFAGAALVPGLLAGLLAIDDPSVRLHAVGADAAAMVLALTVGFLASNLALQYGAARLPAYLTAVVMLTEVLFASISSALLGASAWSLQLGAGGALIVLAALLAATSPAQEAQAG
ncbi:DMT family transporter [Schlegelella sp. ID0723]|uniref:DMT family transporter n=1 Tax=Piscinibacter koreensis TaxID=2742824 RepID=A0A7Y6NJK6_9BURK|nr:DMT family transporter [Schlegelella koreensis]